MEKPKKITRSPEAKRRLSPRILLVCGVLLFAALACVSNGNGGYVKVTGNGASGHIGSGTMTCQVAPGDNVVDGYFLEEDEVLIDGCRVNRLNPSLLYTTPTTTSTSTRLPVFITFTPTP